MTEEKVRTEEYQVSGDDLVHKVKELVHEGNIRRIIIKNEDGERLIEIPLTLGVVGIALILVMRWRPEGLIPSKVGRQEMHHETPQAPEGDIPDHPPDEPDPESAGASARSA